MIKSNCVYTYWHPQKYKLKANEIYSKIEYIDSVEQRDIKRSIVKQKY